MVGLPRQSRDLYDIVVIGGGMVGTCIARDLASIGYQVAVLERSEQIGGVWNTNNYPGLRLHGPGSCYRCLSLAPPWTQERPASEWYRPRRREILGYIHNMADHPGISLKTGCCYRGHLRDHDSLVVQCDDGRQFASRSLIFSTGFSMTSCGPPQLPLDPTLLKPRYRRLVFHSSQLDPNHFRQALEAKRQIVLGSGKAAIELLRQLDPNDNVVWAHRGHTAFIDRDFMNQHYLTDGKQLVRLFKKAHQKARASGKHWTEVAVDEELLVTAGHPLTEQRVKWDGGIVDDADLQHAGQFEQVLIDSIECLDGRARLVPRQHSILELNEDDCLMMCTGQQNPSWSLPSFADDDVASVVLTSVVAPLCSLLPLRLTIDYLEGKRENREEIRSILQRMNMPALLSSAMQPRELQANVLILMQKVTQMIFKNLQADFLYRHEWNQQWYGRDLDVLQTLDDLSHSKSSDAKHAPEPIRRVSIQAA